MKNAKETVLAFLEALNDEDFEKAASYTTDDLVFIGVLGERHGADAYFDDMKKMKLKYAVQKAFADDNEVAVFYDIAMGGKSIFAAGWYTLSHEKIKSFKVIFDPRPLL